MKISISLRLIIYSFFMIIIGFLFGYSFSSYTFSDMFVRQNALIYSIMDTQVRVLHYVEPHKTKRLFCPICMNGEDQSK